MGEAFAFLFIKLRVGIMKHEPLIESLALLHALVDSQT